MWPRTSSSVARRRRTVPARSGSPSNTNTDRRRPAIVARAHQGRFLATTGVGTTARRSFASLSAKDLDAFRIFALIVFCVSSAFFFRFGTIMPSDRATGCDAFGYLRQAALFRSEGAKGIDTELMPDVSRPLVAIAKSTGLAPEEWSQAIAPHCHHYKPATDKVVLQY